MITLLSPQPLTSLAPACLSQPQPRNKYLFGASTQPLLCLPGWDGAEGGGIAQGQSSAHNEAILSRRRGLPHPVQDTPSSAAPPSTLEPWAQTSDLTGGGSSLVVGSMGALSLTLKDKELAVTPPFKFWLPFSFPSPIPTYSIQLPQHHSSTVFQQTQRRWKKTVGDPSFLSPWPISV